MIIKDFFSGIIKQEDNIGNSMKLPVTRIVKIPKIQPYGGFIPSKNLAVEPLTDEPHYIELVEKCCKEGALNPQSLGLVFDYVLRTDIAIMNGISPADAVLNAFEVSFLGAKMINKLDDALKLATKIANLFRHRDKNLKKIVQVASELVVYDAVFRAGYYNPDAKPPKANERDKDAVELMLGATEVYLLEKEHLVSLGFGFTALGAEKVSPSDGDLLTTDSVIDLKCSTKGPTSKHTLQLLLYYILGLHEQPDAFRPLKYIKVVNPRLGMVYSYELSKVDLETLKHIESEIMGYKSSVF